MTLILVRYLSAFLIGSFQLSLYAENNTSVDAIVKNDNNSSKILLSIDENNSTENNTTSQSEKIEKQLQEQIKREEKYAKEKTFYQGDDYNLSSSEVDKSSLENIELLEPDYEFDMDDVYD